MHYVQTNCNIFRQFTKFLQTYKVLRRVAIFSDELRHFHTICNFFRWLIPYQFKWLILFSDYLQIFQMNVSLFRLFAIFSYDLQHFQTNRNIFIQFTNLLANVLRFIYVFSWIASYSVKLKYFQTSCNIFKLVATSSKVLQHFQMRYSIFWQFAKFSNDLQYFHSTVFFSYYL